MEKFSVKKPFTILVAVIMVLLLGFVSITNLQTNLLPDISTPYLMVVTVYPGASPERVESEVSDVMENALGTVSGVESITATSAENYSLLLMKFAEGTDMNSAMVKTSNKVDQTASSLPGTCLTPSIIEYSLNMNAFMTVAVSREGSDVYNLSDFVDNTLVPYVGRTGGVSSVSANGLIEKMVQVQLNQDKIDEVNARLLELIDTQLADARAQLDDAEAQIAEGRAEYEKQLKNFGNTVSDTVMAQMGTEVADAVTVVRDQAQALLSSINQLIGVVNEPEIQQALIDVRDGLQRVVDQFNQTGMRDIDSLIEIVGELRDITDKLTAALQELQGRLGTSDGTVEISGMQDLTSQLSSGLSVKIYGPDADTITALGDKVVQMVNDTEGFTNAATGLGQGDATINLDIDRDKVRAYGLTVAQVYQQIAAKLTTTTTAETPVTVDGSTMKVQISDNLDPVTKENMMDMTFTTSVMDATGTITTGTCTLGDIASWTTGTAPDSITSENQTRYITVTADTLDGYNTTVQSRVLQKKLDAFALTDEMPEGCSFSLDGESSTVNMMVDEMVQWMALALPFVYLVMVAQFQSLLSPFIVLFTVPLAFTGGLLGMLVTGQQLTMISLMGFIVLMGTVVNNGIVFVDYANQLRLGGLERHAALVATGKTRMRPILMTTLTTVLAMLQMVFSNDMASQLMSGMAIVIICGLSYATLMTLYIVPILYDILFKKPPLVVDVGDDGMDDIPDDAAEYIAQSNAAEAQPARPEA